MNEKKIYRIIDSAKGLEPVEPNPYLFNKVLVKLKDKAEGTYQTRPVLVWVSMSVLTLFIAINIYVLASGTKMQKNSNDMDDVAEYYGITNQGGLNYE